MSIGNCFPIVKMIFPSPTHLWVVQSNMKEKNKYLRSPNLKFWFAGLIHKLTFKPKNLEWKHNIEDSQRFQFSVSEFKQHMKSILRLLKFPDIGTKNSLEAWIDVWPGTNSRNFCNLAKTVMSHRGGVNTLQSSRHLTLKRFFSGSL